MARMTPARPPTEAEICRLRSPSEKRLEERAAAQQVVKLPVLMMSLLAHQPIQSNDQRDPRVQGMRLLLCRRKTVTAPAALSSRTARIAGRTRCLGLEPRGYSEEEKDWVYRAYRERGSKRAISRIFDISRCCVEPVARKKGQEAGSVADGLQPADENDVLELDERKDLRLKTVEQTVALGSALSADSTGRCVCDR
ncbi:hypothetical protein GGP56_003281 [Salinibacter ruber]|uniref:Uncharacterized protein n=1 Tax=Salinibacter ruber TaxID=146919 RepID=A0A9X2ZCJ0_9BACT|nr:hypothetical protein [Salinibacter ruber]MCS3616589.1 hypothetical protein [Salinibacter ruber]MCS4037885.1 hypothetical protein [Salinibacter ruber]